MIHRQDRDGVAVLRMEHGKANAFDLELSDDVRRALVTARDPRAVILTGTGSIFSAGVDLFRILKEGPAYTSRFLPAFDAMLQELFAFDRPVVAADITVLDGIGDGFVDSKHHLVDVARRQRRALDRGVEELANLLKVLSLGLDFDPVTDVQGHFRLSDLERNNGDVVVLFIGLRVGLQCIHQRGQVRR